jgi:hypothetical protein
MWAVFAVAALEVVGEEQATATALTQRAQRKNAKVATGSVVKRERRKLIEDLDLLIPHGYLQPK